MEFSCVPPASQDTSDLASRMRPTKSAKHLERTPCMKYNLCYNFIYHNTHKLTAKEYAIKHGLSKSTFSDWLQIFKKDEGQALYHFTEFIRNVSYL